ncbi:MAG: radical SAM protein [Candidatus Riflebacteria bacterium]|nr:radical SAM protein [Candidatus Riflebacteria bacterium]
MWIEPTNRCNLRCPMCPTGLPDGGASSGSMDLSLFHRVVEQLRDRSTVVYLHLAGEPLLHPDLPEMVSVARAQGTLVGFFTNGTLLTDALASRLIGAGLDWIGFSFDGWDPGSHSAVRVGSRFEQTLANVERFLETRRRRASRTPRVTLSVIDLPPVRTPAGRAGLDALRRRLTSLGLDEFQITPAHRWAGASVADPPAGGPAGEETAPSTRCPFPWSGLAVRWDGTYVPCCIDLSGAMPLGRVGEHRLADLWNGETMQRFRSRMARLDLDTLPLCRRCHVVRDRRWFGLPRRVWAELLETLRVRGGR